MSRSIMHDKDGSCYMCDLLKVKPMSPYREEHHVFNGPNRKISEHYGLKVYLCIAHHTIGKEAVHNNSENMLMLKKEGQKAFMKRYPNKDFIRIFGKNYLSDEEKAEFEDIPEKEESGKLGFIPLAGFDEHIMDRVMRRD